MKATERLSPNLPWLSKIRNHLAHLPVPQTEESIWLRILVQLLVIVGILATDSAAQTQMSTWAIPLSIAGGIWSWYRRKKKNIAIKFLIALGMLITMPIFFGNLLSNLNDTRLVLAELLIQLQVLHSFDLPRRKDLGYSMVIGLILLGVAGTISQTLAFTPWLLIFLLVGLPVLVLDYRSRLGLENKWEQKRGKPIFTRLQVFNRYSPLAPQSIFPFLLIIIVLGLGIFLMMPRFPGYQLQTFPVSSPGDFGEKNFNAQNRGIANPGYVREGATEIDDGSGLGKSPLEGKGQVDSSFYYGFNSKMNQNLRGRMEKKMVMRVRSQAPGFWRVLAFDHYTGQGWEISRDEELANFKRSSWSYQFLFPTPQIQGETKRIVQTYTIVSELPNLIPALSYPRQVFFPSVEIGVDAEGSLRSPSFLPEDLTYTVISQVPYRDRTLLGKTTATYPKRISQYYLEIPPQIKEQVKELAETLLAKADREITSNYEKTLYLAQALKQNYSLQQDLPFLDEDEDLVTSFLFKYQGGYPDHFSTVLTVMLRALDIPARLAVGFAPGQFNPFTGYYLVHNTDAYALTEVYFPGYGWFSFDPIPNHEIIPPSFEQDQTFGILKQFWQWLAGWLPSPLTGFLATFWSKLIQIILLVIKFFWRLISGGLFGLFTALIILVVLSFMVWFAATRLVIFSQQRRLAKLPVMARIYQQMLVTLRDKGYPKQPAQTPLEYAKSLQEYPQKLAVEIIREITQAYSNWRYGQQPQNTEYLQNQLKLLQRSLSKIKG